MPRQYNNFSTLATDPLRNFKFLVTIHHNAAQSGRNSGPNFLGRLGFTSVSGLTLTTESIPYRQGGYNTTVHQIPGQTTFSPITLQRGVMIGSRQSWDWMRQLFSTIVGNGLFEAGGGNGRGTTNRRAKNFRTHVDIDVLDHPVTKDYTNNDVTSFAEANDTGPFNRPGTGYLNVPTKLRFRVYNAWINSLSYSDLNAGDNNLLVEQMTLVHEGFDATWAPSAAFGVEAPRPRV